MNKESYGLKRRKIKQSILDRRLGDGVYVVPAAQYRRDASERHAFVGAPPAHGSSALFINPGTLKPLSWTTHALDVYSVS